MNAGAPQPGCNFIHFGLIVTGQTEQAHLPKLFRALTQGICAFEIIRKVEQRRVITSTKRKLKMVGEGKTIPDRDTSEIGIPTRRYLDQDNCRFVMIIDDLEGAAEQASDILGRYRQAVETVIPDQQKSRISVHFLVRMLEAYYFADAQAVNQTLNPVPPIEDYAGDVEDIGHPKGDLKKLHPGFRQIEDGGQILERLNVAYILSHPERCVNLRTMFAWCIRILQKYHAWADSSDIIKELEEKVNLKNGTLSAITRFQLEMI
jgi:hypothetical protein